MNTLKSESQPLTSDENALKNNCAKYQSHLLDQFTVLKLQGGDKD